MSGVERSFSSRRGHQPAQQQFFFALIAICYLLPPGNFKAIFLKTSERARQSQPCQCNSKKDWNNVSRAHPVKRVHRCLLILKISFVDVFVLPLNHCRNLFIHLSFMAFLASLDIVCFVFRMSMINCWYCCNLSLGVALNVQFATIGMCVKNNTHKCVVRTSDNRVISSGVLCFCLLPQCEALRTCRSGFPTATISPLILVFNHFTIDVPSKYRESISHFFISFVDFMSFGNPRLSSLNVRKNIFFLFSSICELVGKKCKIFQKTICHWNIWLELSHQLESRKLNSAGSKPRNNQAKSQTSSLLRVVDRLLTLSPWLQLSYNLLTKQSSGFLACGQTITSRITLFEKVVWLLEIKNQESQKSKSWFSKNKILRNV